MMSATAAKPATTPIPVQLSDSEFTACILPHLSMPKRGPKCKLGYHRVFNLMLWHAIDHQTGKVLAYVFGRRQDHVFLQLKGLLEPFGIRRYNTDYWGTYTRHLDPAEHHPGKWNMQQIERTHVTLRTRIKRLTRKTIGFSRSIQMHDIVLGLFVNRYEFGLPV
jgi:insertion element IS1 protein InsB